jgi:deoxyribodipyrimidine photo-lyase
MKRAIVWFRNDLRVHDNEALHTALKEKMQILPLFCFDPILQSQSAVGKFIKSGPLRTKFLIESVSDLRRNLQAINSNLMIKTGKPAAVIQQLKQQYNIDTVIFHKEVCNEELIDEKDVSSIKGLTVVKPWGHTLIHQDDLPAEMHMGKVPLVYTHFRTKVEKKGLNVRDPLPTPKSINTIEVEDWGTIPTLEQLGYKNVPNDTRAVGVFQGGETVGLQHVKDYIWSKDQLLSSYKETRNDLLGMGASSKFSPWLSLGCISPRYVYQQVKEYESKVEKNESTYWIVFELLWRDYFRFLAPQFGNKIFHLNGINKHKDQRKWSYDQEQLQSWIDGKTGHPMVDANMRELKHTGWMSNRGRQIVASFLAKLMYMDWRFGAEWFESQLIDYDVTSNWLNWMYQAGVGNDPRGAYRIFNPIKQARDFDPQGEYIKKWVPELKDVPVEKLATPWEMSDTEQKQSGCVIGKDYPNPIVAIERPKSAQKRKQPTAKNHKGNKKQKTILSFLV